MAMRLVKNRLLSLSAAAIIMFAAPAHAVKPQPPVTVVCSTVSNKDFVYTAECLVESHGDRIPAHVSLTSMQDKGTLIAKYNTAATNGLGKWTIVFEAHEQKPLPVYFDVHYPDGTVIRATGIYDPYGVLAKPKSIAPSGVVNKKNGVGGVKEYPSN